MRYERENRGLIIKEAYVGLAQHIQQIDAGLALFRMPETVEEYNDNQVFPINKQLQLLVKDSRLKLSRNLLEKRKPRENANPMEEQFLLLNQGIFNPCRKVTAQVLLYIKYDYRGLESVVLYDPA